MFAAAHYAALAVFVVACWGWGRVVMARLAPPAVRDAALEATVTATLGLGIFIVAFQALAIAGVLTRGGVIALVGVGVAAALRLYGTSRREAPVSVPFRTRFASRTWAEKAALVVLVLIAVPSLVAPLAPPVAFDELMYHLPYARLVAQEGGLGIHDWLRYPWFPYNYNLLYAGALLVVDDVLTHFLCALAGWLSVAMLYRLGVLHANRVAAAGGAAIWLGLGDYANSLIDMGVALFVLAACAAMWWWRESPPRAGSRWLWLAAFFLGVAAGSKYQALIFVPLVGAWVLVHERRWRVWGPALAAFLLPCIYWYGRNALQTGDPFNPIGARIFGFTNWNAADYAQQIDDVRVHAAWPSPLIWGVVLAPFALVLRRSAAMRAAAVFCTWSLLVWLATSRYPRYLMASFPLIALMALVGWQALARGVLAGVARLAPGVPERAGVQRAGRVAGGLLLIAVAGVCVQHTVEKAAMISPTPAERDTFLRANVPGYAVMQYLRAEARGRVYQVALIEANYYGPDAVWGDMLGPWRYADYIVLPPDRFAGKLRQQGFEALAVSRELAPTLAGQPGFADHFALLYERDGARAYRILPAP